MPYAGYPSVFIRDEPSGKKKRQQLLWGDFLEVLEGEEDGWVEVRGRGERGWIRADEMTDQPLLEVYFVDIGQGDGCFIVAPKDDEHPERFLLVDAGEKDNMFRFLSWRFNLRDDPDRVLEIDTAVISHPDQDHYGGFQPLFGSAQVRFRRVVHNGLVERAGDRPLGATAVHDDAIYAVGLCKDRADVEAVVLDPDLAGRKLYPKLLAKALGSGRVDDIRMVSSKDEHLPGYEAGQALAIEVLGPVPTELPDGKLGLRGFDGAQLRKDKVGKTKNGHSVVLKLVYGKVRVLLGGDLNIPSERHLLAHYTGLPPVPRNDEEREALVESAREKFGCDVAKACHHGSADFSTVFLEAVHPVATVVSSGDDESHCHPRPDSLGAIGKASRGSRPLLFSTELARSHRESVKNPNQMRNEIREISERIAETSEGSARERLRAELELTLKKIERSVAVFGMISLRTDGEKVLMAQKLEQPRSVSGEEFDISLLEPAASGELAYVSKHDT